MSPSSGRNAALLVGLALGLLVSLSALAQPVPRTAPGAVPAAAAAPPPARWTLAQLQLAFVQADTDGSGELSRAEAQQLVILPRSFEDLDRNKDGVLSRPEYESILQRQ